MSILARRIAWRIPQTARAFATASTTPVSVPGKNSETTPAPTQAPNAPSTWSSSQNAKAVAYDNARFEQVSIPLQPNSLAAVELVDEDPIRFIKGRTAACDGGGGALGHPKIYINLDKPGPRACGYCGIRYEQEHGHH